MKKKIPFQIETEHPAQLVILSGKPFKRNLLLLVVPFVMNTQEEINQANIDFQQGKFGAIPY